MFGSSTLEVAIGLAFVFLLLSLICTTLTELIARWFSLRSRTLEEGIRGMLGEDPKPAKSLSSLLFFWRKGTVPIDIAKDEKPAGKLYNHPLIAAFTGRSWQDMVLDRMGRPSYIPSRTFALALLDTVAPPASSTSPNSFWDIRQKVVAISTSTTGRPGEKEEKMVAKALLPLIDAAEDDLKAARENVEKWFDDAMERVSGWYKRRTQLIILILALAVAGGFNADTFMMASAFSTDASLRTAVVNAAQQAAEKAKPEDVAASVGDAQAQLDKLQIPVGWTRKPGETCQGANAKGETVDRPFSFDRARPCDVYGWFMKILGLLLTAVALSLGAPFWFDLLSKLVNLRSGGAKPAKEAAAGATASRP